VGINLSDIDELIEYIADLDLKLIAEQLQGRDRAIFVFSCAGYTQKEISSLFNITKSMVSSRIRAIEGNARKRVNRTRKVN